MQYQMAHTAHHSVVSCLISRAIHFEWSAIQTCIFHFCIFSVFLFCFFFLQPKLSLERNLFFCSCQTFSFRSRTRHIIVNENTSRHWAALNWVPAVHQFVCHLLMRTPHNPFPSESTHESDLASMHSTLRPFSFRWISQCAKSIACSSRIIMNIISTVRMRMHYSRLLFASISNICISSATHWLSHLACIHSLWRVSSLLELQGISTLYTSTHTHMQNCRCAVCNADAHNMYDELISDHWTQRIEYSSHSFCFFDMCAVCASSSRPRLLKVTISWVLCFNGVFHFLSITSIHTLHTLRRGSRSLQKSYSYLSLSSSSIAAASDWNTLLVYPSFRCAPLLVIYRKCKFQFNGICIRCR